MELNTNGLRGIEKRRLYDLLRVGEMGKRKGRKEMGDFRLVMVECVIYFE